MSRFTPRLLERYGPVPLQVIGAVGLAVIASVYASGAVPGEFLPGASEAFLTSALLALLALATVLTVVRRPLRIG
jgi:hypothetical protein